MKLFYTLGKQKNLHSNYILISSKSFIMPFTYYSGWKALFSQKLKRSMKRLLIIGLAFTVCDALYAEEDMPGLSLREAEKCFLEHNVQLTAQRYNVDRAQAQVVQARLFDNRSFRWQNVYNLEREIFFDVGKEGEAAIEIEQEIPIARQRNKRIKLEEINREAAGYRFEEVLRTLRSELYRSFVDTYYQSRSIRVYDREITSVGKLLQAVREQEEEKATCPGWKYRVWVVSFVFAERTAGSGTAISGDEGTVEFVVGCSGRTRPGTGIGREHIGKGRPVRSFICRFGHDVRFASGRACGPCRSACGRSECETAKGDGGSRVFR